MNLNMNYSETLKKINNNKFKIIKIKFLIILKKKIKKNYFLNKIKDLKHQELIFLCKNQILKSNFID